MGSQLREKKSLALHLLDRGDKAGHVGGRLGREVVVRGGKVGVGEMGVASW